MTAIFDASTSSICWSALKPAWARAHQRAVFVVERRLHLHFLDFLWPDGLAEDVGREHHVAELGDHLGVPAGIFRHAVAGVDEQHGGALAGDRAVIGEIALQFGVAVLVVDGLGMKLRASRGGEEHDGAGERRAENGDGMESSHLILPRSVESATVIRHSIRKLLALA
jgi:hypothetical protein